MTQSLFENDPAEIKSSSKFEGSPSASSDSPLAARMRPRTLDEFVGQTQIVGDGTVLRRSIEQDTLSSMIFYGPPGVGKSTLAHIIAHSTRAHFENFSAAVQGVPELRKVIEAAGLRRRANGMRTVLFVDEIHRFNKSQQDTLLPHVEGGTVVLIGATTENPYFEVNAPLLSRASVLVFAQHTSEQIGSILDRALADSEHGLGALGLTIAPEAKEHLISRSGGDARMALNALELSANSTPVGPDEERVITLETVEQALQRKAFLYDKQGDNHYDTVSAFIKSIRGSDPDAGLHYLAKMLTAGEDARFIARRLVVLASEDIGNADPIALLVANAAAHAVEYVGLPEAQINLAHAVTYLASAPKSNASYVGLKRAVADVKAAASMAVPPHLRDSHSTMGRNTGDAPGYLYPHDDPRGWVPQQYIPDGVQTQPYYEPTTHGREASIRNRLEGLKQHCKEEDTA